MSDTTTTDQRLGDLQQRAASAMQAFSQSLHQPEHVRLAGVPVVGAFVRMMARIRHLTALGHCQELALQTQYDQIQALADQIRQLQASREQQDRRIEQVTAQMSYLPGSVNTLVGELRQRLDHLSSPAGPPAKP